MSNPPEYARESATTILQALEESHLGNEVFNAGRPTPAGIYPVVSSIVLAIGGADVELVSVDGGIGSPPQSVSGVVIAGDIIVSFSGESDYENGLAPEFKVKARSLRDLVAVTVESVNLFATGPTLRPGQASPKWPGRPNIELSFRDGELVPLPLSRHATAHEREMVARFVGRVPSLLGR